MPQGHDLNILGKCKLPRLPNGQMLNRWLSEKNVSSVVRLRLGKEMLHVLYIIMHISYPRKRIKNLGTQCNLLWVPTFMV